MADLRQAAQMALEALESAPNTYVHEDDEAGQCGWCQARSYRNHYPGCRWQSAREALRAALAAAQEPVAPGGTLIETAPKPLVTKVGDEVIVTYLLPYDGPEVIGGTNAG